MLKIRLKRAGGRNHPFYRVAVIDSRKRRDGRALEEIGYYNPLENPVVVNIDRDRVQFWAERGAQLSDSVRTLLRHDNSGHPTRRTPDTFEPEVKEAKRPRKAMEEKATAEAVAVAKPAGPRGDEAKEQARAATAVKEVEDDASPEEVTEVMEIEVESSGEAEEAPAGGGDEEKPSEG